ncbi:MAG TPA: endopeptidase La [Terriglobia bacterium]|nr:endopeptidase La [Terriglobia bacterium]
MKDADSYAFVQDRVVNSERLPETIPLLPVRNVVVFPLTVLPLTVGRESSVRLLEHINSLENRFLGIIAQRDPDIDEPQEIDLHAVGTLAVASKQMRAKDQSLVVVVQGLKRFKIREIVQNKPYLEARVSYLEDVPPTQESSKVEALRRSLLTLFQQMISLSPNLSSDLRGIAESLENPSNLVDLIATVTPSLSLLQRQDYLETLDVWKRMEKLNIELTREVEILELKSKIQTQVHDEVGKNQREYYLREQLKAIQKELGEGEDSVKEMEDLQKAIEDANMPEEVKTEALRELKRLARMSSASAEYTVSRTYLDWLVSLPWNKAAQAEINLEHSRDILDRDHYGLKKIKQRILEYLAVLKLKSDGKAPILCFVGPPGVGKTSLGKSIADSLGRKFVRISLGGIRDEAEIRGHRRTYIGSLPGQIIQGIRRAGERNPVFMLDEVDKIGADFRGDPAAALLEVLDPQQNHSFRDHYLDVPFDLSKVLFITTANVPDTIPPALLDRMEVIELHGYTEEEKLKIAEKYLIPRQAEENGVTIGVHLDITPEAVRHVIRQYTREAGLRNLERELSRICRKRARQLVEGEQSLQTVQPDNLQDLLGVPRVILDTEIEERASVPGVAIGLAWTPAGGDILFVEASRMKGKREITMTGQLGNVMQESVKASFSWVRAHTWELGIDDGLIDDSDIHIHVPAGAIPKDGPSAGITMVTTLVSLLAGKPVRPRLAMTGEVTLTGKVLPVGGIKEKVLAAHRLGLKEVILPKENEKHVLEDIPIEITEDLVFHFVGQISQVIEIALGLQLKEVNSLVDSAVRSRKEGRPAGPVTHNLN